MIAGKCGLEWGRCEGKIDLVLILILFIAFSGKGFFQAVFFMMFFVCRVVVGFLALLLLFLLFMPLHFSFSLVFPNRNSFFCFFS